MMFAKSSTFSRFAIGATATVLLLAAAQPSPAATAAEIDTRVNSVLKKFRSDVGGGRTFLETAKGVLVFPHVIKVGFGFGGEFGEGALRVGGKTVAYYNTVSGSVGFQLGGQSRAIVLCFLTDEALKRFRNSEGWEIGVDGSVALITVGIGESIDSNSIKDPVVGFVFNNKGLMYNLTLEGTKMTKIVK